MSSRYVEIAGGIAAGKTTLLKALESPEIAPVYENHSLNPFWEAFYTEPTAYAFETEITFLLQHYHFAKAARNDGRLLVLDHSFELDYAYACVGLHAVRRSIFSTVYEEIRRELGWPTTLIWIRCAADEELRRIRNRARQVEQDIDQGFLANLNRELETAVLRAKDHTTVVELDSQQVDFRKTGDWLQHLTAALGFRSTLNG